MNFIFPSNPLYKSKTQKFFYFINLYLTVNKTIHYFVNKQLVLEFLNVGSTPYLFFIKGL